ncbi:uncharacterized protein LOC142638108 [Castanea sativa]|uniref:uncharacterized protein LOC142638108 n=1 Tax=Castanea sativa TaxID=21020 RepID=UPI003F64EEFA
MVVPLGPGKFYGSSLPRPRIYTDVKYSDERVDPPVPVLDPFMSWANEAHWSMGGLSFTRLRFQGRIEGSVTKLRAERERMLKKEAKNPDSPNGSGPNRPMKPILGSDSPPPAPIATKRRRYLAMIDDEEEEEEEEEVVVVKKRRLVKKLGDDFDKVAMESERNNKVDPKKDSGHGSGSVAMKTRSRVEEEVGERVSKSNSKGKKLKGGSGQSGGVKSGKIRTSPRLAKRGSP